MIACRHALEALYRVRAIDRAIARRLPPDHQFQAVAEADQRFVTALGHLFNLMDWPLPADHADEAALEGEALAKLAATALRAEMDCLDLYDRVLAGGGNPTVRAVVGNLRRAALSWRLPAREAMAETATAAPPAAAQ